MSSMTHIYILGHGTAGNAYVFLSLYEATKDERYFIRALHFADWCCDYSHHEIYPPPDDPWSLMNGLAGTIKFLTDVRAGKYSVPGFGLDYM